MHNDACMEPDMVLYNCNLGDAFNQCELALLFSSCQPEDIKGGEQAEQVCNCAIVVLYYFSCNEVVGHQTW